MTEAISRLKELTTGLMPDTLGIEFLAASPDRVTAVLTVRTEICTSGGMLHGGAIMAFADTLGAAGTLLSLPAGSSTTTIESKTNFVRGAALGSRVFGECTPVHRGRTTMVWQTQVKSEAGKLLALVTQTQLVLSA